MSAAGGTMPSGVRWTRRRRVLAVLCSGLVLGVGSTATLAAWTDNEYGRATFGASTFNLQSKDATTSSWGDHATGSPVVFTTVAGMSPGADAYVGLDVRTSSDSTVGGTAGLVADTVVAPGSQNGTNGLPLSDVLEYRAVRITGTSPGACSGAFVGGASYLAGTSSTYVPVSTQPATTTATLAAGGADQHRYCFDVRIKPGADNGYQGGQTTITWHVAGIST